MAYSITKNGVALDKSLYTINEKDRIFSCSESYLVLDFKSVDEYTFKTGHACTFKTGYGCTFNTGYGCTFNTGTACTFNTDSVCTFKTGSVCTFKTGSDCTFKTGSDCTFKAGSDCTFDTGYDSTFCVQERCVIVRRDFFEIINPKPNVKIKLNDFMKPGFTVLESEEVNNEEYNNIITINGVKYKLTKLESN